MTYAVFSTLKNSCESPVLLKLVKEEKNQYWQKNAQSPTKLFDKATRKKSFKSISDTNSN